MLALYSMQPCGHDLPECGLLSACIIQSLKFIFSGRRKLIPLSCPSQSEMMGPCEAAAPSMPSI